MQSVGQHIGFKRFAVVTVIAVYLVILAGGVVRTTGSGMGCPDWPKCFGNWTPPTNISQLPADYKIKYSVHGYVADFNVTKTWIEYINRLLGALIGLFVLILFVLSFNFKKDMAIRWLTGVVLLLVLLEGIVGKYVVSTNLRPVVITFHMLGSVVIILLLIYTMCRIYREDLNMGEVKGIDKLKKINYLLIIITFIQVLIGTQVRQEIDAISAVLNFEHRESWIDKLSNLFLIHRFFSWIVLGVHLYFTYELRKASNNKILTYSYILLLVLLLTEITAGVVMNYLNMPAAAQPIHMLVGTMLLGNQFFVLYMLILNPGKENAEVVPIR